MRKKIKITFVLQVSLDGSGGLGPRVDQPELNGNEKLLAGKAKKGVNNRNAFVQSDTFIHGASLRSAYRAANALFC